MLYTSIGNIPKHQYVYVDSNLTHKEDLGMIPAIWFGLVSHPGRIWGCNVLLECGAIYRNVPIFGISCQKVPDRKRYIAEYQRWNCYGKQFTTLEYTYFHGLQMSRLDSKTKKIAENGIYIFTASHVDDGFSEEPSQAKEFHFCYSIEDGRVFVMPTDLLVVHDDSFVEMNFEQMSKLKNQIVFYTCE